MVFSALQVQWKHHKEMESTHAAYMQMTISGMDRTIYELYKIIFRNFDAFRLIGIMSVCRTFFVLGRELVSLKIPAIIKEREEAKLQILRQSEAVRYYLAF